MGTPVYYVLAEQVQESNYAVFRILRVVEADLEEIDHVYNAIIGPMTQRHPRVMNMIFQREPANPFQEWAPEGETEKTAAVDVRPDPSVWDM
jgi:hypothetical protein